jgi:tRNA G18 (ribose-2'-O)-methylase SpoU
MDTSSLRPGDGRLDPYRDLKARSARREDFSLAICEGAYLVASALEEAAAGRLRVRSLLVAEPRRQEWAGQLPPGADLLVLPEAELQSLLGFGFHRGVLACVEPPVEKPVAELLACNRLLVLPRIDQEENLGLLLRTAAALGMEGVLLGRGASLWARRTLRTSMGGAFRIPVWQREDPSALLQAWQSVGGETVAAALGPGCEDSRRWRPAARTALMLGPEDRGLEVAWLARAQRRLRIPMAGGMDSLNVAAAGAILMDRLCGGA